MLTALIFWVYVGFLLLVYGCGGLLLLRRIFGWANEDALPLPVLALLGLACVNIIASALSLFMPLSLTANIILFAGALLLARPAWGYINPPARSKRLDALSLLALALAALLILENATRVPSNPDTNLYHAQAIRWIESYRAVPGLGNLHTRLAFNSNWLVLNALFSFAFLGLRSFHLLPSLLFLIVTFYFLSGFIELGRGNLTMASLIKAALPPISLHIWASELSSPGTDLPTSLLIWVVLIVWIESRPQPRPEVYQTIAFILSLTAITFKLSALPLLLLGAWWGFKGLMNKNIKLPTALILLASFCWLPWFARNFIISGYWVYPVPALIPLSPVVDWRIPPDTVIHEVAVTQIWARHFTAKPEPGTSNFWGWFPYWFSRQSLLQRLLLLTSSLFPPFFALFSLLKRRAPDLVLVTAYAGVLFWFFTVPTIRFGYGFLVMSVLFMAAAVLSAWFQTPRTWSLAAIFRGVTVLYLGFLLFRSVDASTLSQRLLLPADYRNFRTVSCEISNATVQCATQYSQCGYHAFPCVVKAFPYVELRGNDWQSGFRVIQP